MGDEASSCTDLIRAFENAGLSHYDTVETLNRLHENQVLTDSGFRQAIECVSEVITDARPSASASDVFNGDGPRQSETQGLSLRHAQANTGPSVGPSTDTEEYKRNDDQVLGIESHINGPRRGLQYLIRPIRYLSRPFRRSSHRLPRFVPSSITARASGNPYLVIVSIESELDRQPLGSGIRSATLLIDTGSGHNIISLELAELICPKHDFKSATPRRLANTVGGSIDTLGTVPVRWYINSERSPSSQFPKKFAHVEFHVSAQRLEFDAILGWEDIVRLQLVSLHPQLGFVGVISKAPKVDKRSAARVEAEAAETRRAQADQMTTDRTDPQVQQQREAYAHEQAHARAQAYVNLYRQYHGEQGLMQAYQTRYAEVYNQIYYGQHAAS